MSVYYNHHYHDERHSVYQALGYDARLTFGVDLGCKRQQAEIILITATYTCILTYWHTHSEREIKGIKK